MDNIITSVINQNLALPSTDKGVISGQITEVPDILQNLSRGDSLILKFINDSNILEVGNKLSVDINISGSKIPVNIKLDTPMKFEPHQLHQLVAKVISNGTEGDVPTAKINFQVISIDNQRPEIFVAKAEQKQGQAIIQSPIRQEGTDSAAIITDVNNAGNQIKLVPQKLNEILAKPLNEMNFPKETIEELNKFFSKVNVEFELKNILPQEGKEENTKQVFENFADRIKQILKPLQTQENTQILNHLQKLLKLLPQGEMPAQTETRGTTVILTTPLGKVLSETALKIKPETSVTLQMKISPQSFEQIAKLPGGEQANTLLMRNTIPSTTKLLESIFEKLNPQKLPQTEKNILKNILPDKSERWGITNISKTTGQNSSEGVLKILSGIDKTQISEKIQNKIPQQNNRILSNMINFQRAAEQKDISLWLGQELVSEIKTLEGKGSETLQQLNQFMNASVKENVAWRTVEIPFFDGNQLGKIAVSVKKSDADEEQENQPKNSSKGQRFLVDTDFSLLGKFQFDGFTIAKERRFDLVIRTSKRMEKDFCSEIMNLFKTSMYNVGYAGTIKINQQEKFINIEETTDKQLTDGIYI